MEGSFVNPDNTGYRASSKYAEVINQINENKVCPFCPEHLATYHKNPILKENTHWLATNNMYPYEGAAHHLLLIHKQHIEDFAEISVEAWKELNEIIAWAIKEKAIQGGSLLMRFGNTACTGASVSHLHANIVSGDLDNKDRKPIVTRIG